MSRHIYLNLTFAVICTGLSGCAGTITPSRQNPADYSVLESAVEGCDIEKAKALLAVHPDLVNKQGWDRTTPLYLAAQNNCPDVARLLLDKGALVDARSASGATPLHIAAQKGAVQIAALLLSRRADINAIDVQHRTPLDRALAWKQPRMASFLKQHGGRQGKQQTLERSAQERENGSVLTLHKGSSKS